MTRALDEHYDTIFRIGVASSGPSGQRWMVSETWLLTTTVFNFHPNSQGVSDSPWTRWYFPFGADDPRNIGTQPEFQEQIYPWVKPSQFGIQGWRLPRAAILNPLAPEASLRLQRVGADDSGERLGRLSYPILSSSMFTDAPHCRHVDAADLQLRLDQNMTLHPMTFTSGTTTLQNVIFHRKSRTVTSVDSYRILTNPTRYWQRWRNYPMAPHTRLGDSVWYPTLTY